MNRFRSGMKSFVQIGAKAPRLFVHAATVIRKRGLKYAAGATKERLRIYYAKLEDYSFDVLNGTDTMGKTPVAELQVSGTHQKYGTGYQPSRDKPFKKVMSTLALPSNSVFIDFGCGKGRIILAASELDFKRVIGVEFAGELCEVAKKNIMIFQKKARVRADIKVLHADAAEYEFAGDENVIFMSNPFNEVVMGKVLDNVAASLHKHPRHIWFIYMNPVCHDFIEKHGTFSMIAYHKFVGSGRDFVVYESRSHLVGANA